MFLTFCFIVLIKINPGSQGYSHSPVPDEITVIKSSATISAGIDIRCFQKSWIPNKDNFRLLSVGRTDIPFYQKSEHLLKLPSGLRAASIGITLPLTHNRKFSRLSDEIPILG